MFLCLIYSPISPANINKNVLDITIHDSTYTYLQTDQLSFAAFADTHIGARYQYPTYHMASYLDKIGDDLISTTNLLDFALHLGDIVNHNTAQINGIGLPFLVNQYQNNLKKYFISHINLPLHCVIGNHDINDYEMNEDNPHNLTLSLIDELSMNSPIYAMMRSGILFLIVPELGYVQWTHPVEYTWIEHMVSQYPDTTTIIFCHQAIEDTTYADEPSPYRGKQDMDWWATLFQNNPQIKMWIHGHNHHLSWYLGNQSTGITYPIRQFSHEIAFSAPYSQLDWGCFHEEDRIVIYNISSTGIQTATWEHNLLGGQWIPEYQHTWRTSTTYDSDAENWYLFTMFLQDNETQKTDMKIISPDITLQLVGTKPMELFYDSHMEAPSGRVDEKILGFGNDRSEQVIWNKPGMKIHGPYSVTFPEKYPYNSAHEDGRSGQPYQSFPMGTICTAIPGQTYTITITARSNSGTGRINLTMNCTDWGTHSQYSILPNSSHTVLNHQVGTTFENIQGNYTVPQDTNAWFLQGSVHFLDATEYDVSLFSIQRARTSNHTNNFRLNLSEHWYNTTGDLKENEIISFPIKPENLANSEGIINYTARINGNHYGMAQILYKEPLLLCRNARFRINSYSQGILNLSLTKTITRTPSTPQQDPLTPNSLNLLVQNIFSNKIIIGSILFMVLILLIHFWKSSHQPYTSLFKLIPYTTNVLYHQINISADDHSAIKQTSPNGNIWFTTTLPKNTERNLLIFIPNLQ